MRTILITIVVRYTLMYKIIKGFFLVFILGLQHELVQESHSEEEESHELFFFFLTKGKLAFLFSIFSCLFVYLFIYS